MRKLFIHSFAIAGLALATACNKEHTQLWHESGPWEIQKATLTKMKDNNVDKTESFTDAGYFILWDNNSTYNTSSKCEFVLDSTFQPEFTNSVGRGGIMLWDKNGYPPHRDEIRFLKPNGSYTASTIVFEIDRKGSNSQVWTWSSVNADGNGEKCEMEMKRKKH